MDVFYISSSFYSVSSCTLRFAKALEMHDFPGPEELDGIADIRVIGKAENIVVGNASLLLCYNRGRTTKWGPNVFKRYPDC